jgi:hypothetical protein
MSHLYLLALSKGVGKPLGRAPLRWSSRHANVPNSAESKGIEHNTHSKSRASLFIQTQVAPQAFSACRSPEPSRRPSRPRVSTAAGRQRFV